MNHRISIYRNTKKRKVLNDYILMLFFLILISTGFVMGLYLSKYIEVSDQNMLTSYMSVLIDKTNPNDFFVTQFMLATFSIILIVLLGSSLCGFPMISFFIYTKGAQIGFSCALFISTYSYKGILGIIMVFLPQTILDIIAIYIISHFSLYFSISLVKSSISTCSIPLKNKINQLLNILFVCFFLIFVSSYFKSTLGIELIRLFENL